MGDMSLETCRAIKKHWNNKVYYTVASCWFFLRDLYYDARIHGHQVYNRQTGYRSTSVQEHQTEIVEKERSHLV